MSGSPLATVAGLASAWLWWSQRTVIAPYGLRAKVGWRWRDLTWDEIGSVDAPSRWAPTQVLSVTTTDGQVIATHVPAGLHREVVAYAGEHRSTQPRTPMDRDDDAR
jgi:DNA primase